MTKGREGPSCPSGCASPRFSPCRCIAFHPQFLAVAAALVTAASVRRLVSALDLVEEEAVVSRLDSSPNDPNDPVDWVSDLTEEFVKLAGLGGYEDEELEPKVGSMPFIEDRGVMSLCGSECVDSRDEDAEDWLPCLSIFVGLEGEPTGLEAGEFEWEIAEMAAIACLCSEAPELLNASAFATSLLTTGDEALANEPDLRALGFSGRDA